MTKKKLAADIQFQEQHHLLFIEFSFFAEN